MLGRLHVFRPKAFRRLQLTSNKLGSFHPTVMLDLADEGAVG